MECPSCHQEAAADSVFCGKCGSRIQGLHDILDLPQSTTRTLNILGLEFEKDQIVAGKYRIIEQLGKGGMGIVYKAEDVRLKRIVALKFLRPEFLIDQEAKSRFLLEAQAAASMDHPNICAVYEINDVQNQTFIAMPLIEGKSLREKLGAGMLDRKEIVSFGIQIAEGLAEAHRKGIIHRDIKLANIMVTDKNQAKIMDFGLAKLMEGSDLTATTKIMGTVAYMSPEQAKGLPIDKRTDLWSLGIVLYELLAGFTPFETKRNQAMIYSILNETPKPLRKVNPDIPASLETVIDRCLQKNPENRYPTAETLVKDLRASLKDLELGIDSKLSWTRFKLPSRKKDLLRLGLPAAGAVAAIVLAVIIFGSRSAQKKPLNIPQAPLQAEDLLPGAAISYFPIEDIFGDGKSLKINFGQDQVVEKGATGRIFSKREFDQDKSKNFIGQFVVKDIKLGQIQTEIVNQVGLVQKGDYAELDKEPQGTLMIRTNPEEAEIYVNDVLRGRSDVKLILAPMKYRILIKKKDYIEKPEEIELRTKEIVDRNYTLIAKAVATPQMGNLFVDTNPQGAQVFLDDKRTPEGRTPINLPLTPARHRLRVATDNYVEQTYEVEIKGGQNIDRTFSLVPIEEELDISSIPPGADIFIGDDLEGKTPLKKTYRLGSYRIKVRKEGFQDYDEDVILSRGAPIKRMLELKQVPIAPPKYTLIVNSVPEEGAKIFINNEEKGNTPKKIELSDPQAQLRIEKTGYKPYAEKIVMKSSEEIKNAVLTKLGKGKLSVSAYPRAQIEIDGALVDGTVPPVKVLEVDEGVHKIKFLFDDNVEVIKTVSVEPNETKSVHCDESQEAVDRKGSYEISAYPKAALQLDGAAKGDTPPLKTWKVTEGSHKISFNFQTKEAAIILMIADILDQALKKKAHAACETVDFNAPENQGMLQDVQGQGYGDVVLVRSNAPLGVDLDDVERGDVLPGRDLKIAGPSKDRYQFGLYVRNANEKYFFQIWIFKFQEQRILKFTLQIDLIN